MSDDPEQPAAIPTTAGELTQPLIDGMPEVTDTTPPAPNSPPPVEPAPKKSPGTGKYDSAGVEFDPTIHFYRTDRPGTPRKDKFGNWWRPHATGARPAIETITPTFAGTEADPPPPAPRYRINAEKLAAIAIPTFDRFMQGVLTEGAALDDDDKRELTPALVAYIESSEMKDVPPALMLTIVVVGIYASKLNKPTVKERITLYYLKIKSLFFSRR